MPLPVPYIQNDAIAFSRISGYDTKKKKKTARRLGPFQISVAEIEVGEPDGKEQGRRKPSLSPHEPSA